MSYVVSLNYFRYFILNSVYLLLAMICPGGVCCCSFFLLLPQFFFSKKIIISGEIPLKSRECHWCTPPMMAPNCFIASMVPYFCLLAQIKHYSLFFHLYWDNRAYASLLVLVSISGRFSFVANFIWEYFLYGRGGAGVELWGQSCLRQG